MKRDVSIIDLDDEKVRSIRAAGLGNCDDVVEGILNDHSSELEGLADNFLSNDPRETVDDDSLEVESVSIDETGAGTCNGSFGSSVYAGCKDANSSGNPNDFDFDLQVDLEKKQIEVSTPVVERRDTYDEL